MYCTPGPDSSSLISTEKAVPNSPENSANIRYNVPISFALLDKNQRSHHMLISEFFIATVLLLDFNSKLIGKEKIIVNKL